MLREQLESVVSGSVGRELLCDDVMLRGHCRVERLRGVMASHHTDRERERPQGMADSHRHTHKHKRTVGMLTHRHTRAKQGIKAVQQALDTNTQSNTASISSHMPQFC
eukprot:3727418-Rhodomonas_salina.2